MGQTDYKSRISNREKIFQIGTEIGNREIRDFKSGQRLQIGAERRRGILYEYPLILLIRVLLRFIHTSG